MTRITTTDARNSSLRDGHEVRDRGGRRVQCRQPRGVRAGLPPPGRVEPPPPRDAGSRCPPPHRRAPRAPRGERHRGRRPVAVLAGGADQPQQENDDRQASDRLLLVGDRVQVARELGHDHESLVEQMREDAHVFFSNLMEGDPQVAVNLTDDFMERLKKAISYVPPEEMQEEAIK